MPWSSNGGGGSNRPNNGGPWGGGGRGSGGGRSPWGGGGNKGGGGGGPGGGGQGGGGGGQGPNIDDFFKKGQDQLKTVLGDGGGSGGLGILLALLLAAGAWVYASVYTVRADEQALVLTFGKFTRIDGAGLGFAPWPVQTVEIRAVTRENIIEIGSGEADAPRSRGVPSRSEGLMLTGDANLIDLNFSVIWNISELDKFLFNLARPEETISAVAQSAMREVVGQSELQPLLNRDRGLLEQSVKDLVQVTMDELQSGVAVLRVTLDRADPPADVRQSFLDVQAAEQERDTLQKQAQAYFNQRTAQARGESAQMIEQAEAYRAQVVAGAEGEAARFVSVLTEYELAPDVTRKRLYLETMERVFAGMNKIVIDESVSQGGQGVVPYLPLNELTRRAAPTPAPARVDQ